MVIANLDGQVEKIFRLNAGREKTEQARNNAAQNTDAPTTDYPNAASQTSARTPEPNEREESSSTHTVNHEQTTTTELDDAGLPVWLL